jgi:hypothetical protein
LKQRDFLCRGRDVVIQKAGLHRVSATMAKDEKSPRKDNRKRSHRESSASEMERTCRERVC